MKLHLSSVVAMCLATGLAPDVFAQVEPGEGPALGLDRTQQSDIANGLLTLDEIRADGLKIFATPTNRYDGYGDGPVNALDTTSPGGRPTLQGNGTFLRINGLDAQNCQECHSVGSFATAPFRFEVGGVGGSNNNAIFQPRNIDVDDSDGAGEASFDGRYINPPFLFGSGGVELLAKEMTKELNAAARMAKINAGTVIPLVTKGVDFGTISYDAFSGLYDVTNVEGVDVDLVVRPFGRKGEFETVRQFDVGALNFHFGMQPEEDVGTDVDADNDGVVNEILVGELSALHIFNTNLERPTQDPLSPDAANGQVLFNSIGCTDCHIPFLDTKTPVLTYSFPEVPSKPALNVFYAVDLNQSPAGFDLAPGGGIRVPLFSDLKRHDMGPGLAEDFGHHLDSEFVTARLWGIADTAPYLHDGRALTLTDAVLMHGGEAQAQRDAFEALPAQGRIEVLSFLRSLRTPVDAAADLLP